MSEITDLMLELNNEKRHNINNLLTKHILQLTEQVGNDRIIEIHKRYEKAVKDNYIEYFENTKYGNLCIAMNNSYINLKIDLYNEKLKEE